MAKEVRIKSLSLTNYRGIGSLDLNFDGKSGQIMGKNRAGKTTVIEAIEWLISDALLGDRHDLPSIKPLSDTKKKVCAEAAFDVDGEEMRVRKEYYETWVRHKGDESAVMEGHATDYYINGAKSNLKTFQNGIEERLGFAQRPGDVDWFQTLTDPFYFSKTLCGGDDWKDARKAIIEMVGDVTNAEVFAKCPGSLLAKADLEAHKYVAKDGATVYDDFEARKALKGQIDLAKQAIVGKQAVIDEYGKSAKPDPAEVAFAQSKIDEGDASVAKLNAGDSSAYNSQIDDAQRRLIQRQKDYQESIKAPEVDRAKSQALAKEMRAKNGAMWDAKSKLSEARYKAENLKAQIDLCQSKRQGFIDRVNAVNKRIADYKPGEECPTCHQPLPRDMVEKAKKEYIANCEADGAAAVAEGRANKAQLDKYQAELGSLNVAGLEEAANVAAKEADDAKKAYDEAYEAESQSAQTPKADESAKAEIDAIEKEIADLREKKRTANQDTAQKVAEIRDGLAPYRATVQRQADYDSALRGRERAEGEMRDLQKRQADLEGRQAAVALFVKTKLELLDEHIAKVFGSIRFQLVSPNIRQGSYDEVCNPYVFDVKTCKSSDVLLFNGSKSEQVRTGCAIAKAIGDHYGFPKMPMLFDEGGEMDQESLRALYDYLGPRQQVISVKVCDDFKTPVFMKEAGR